MSLITLREETYKVGKSPSERSVQEALQYGVVAIDKPVGPNSHEVAAFARKILRAPKAGHTGTLDANVSGVLVVLLNNACKVNSYLGNTDKEYVCLMTMQRDDIKRVELESAFSLFRGEIYQTPPLASAVAKKLRTRTIHRLSIIEHNGRFVLFKANVDAGTYIRNLVFDIGEVLGVKTEMTELRRTIAAGISEQQSTTLQNLSDYYWLYSEKKRDDIRKLIIPVEEIMGLKKVIVGDDCLHAITTGADLAMPGVNQFDSAIKKGEQVAIHTGKGELVAVANALMPASKLKTEKKGIAFDIERVIHSF